MAAISVLSSSIFRQSAPSPSLPFPSTPSTAIPSRQFPPEPSVHATLTSPSVTKFKSHRLSLSSSTAQLLEKQRTFLSKQQIQQPHFDTNLPSDIPPSHEAQILYHNCIELLRLSVRCSDVGLGKAVHASILKFEEDSYLSNALITAYLRLGLVFDADGVFTGMPAPDVVSYTALISFFAKSCYELEAVELFFRMRESGIEPNEFSFVALLTACSRIGDLGLGFQVHSLIIKLGYLCSTYVVNALMGLYSKCRCLEDAFELFDKMPERDITSWNTVIAGMVGQLMYESAFELFYAMQKIHQLRADHFTLSSILNACADCSASMEGREIHAYALKIGLESNLSVNNALITFYTNCRDLKDVEILFDRMPVKDVFSWTSMITAYMEFGMVDLAIEMFSRMPERNSVSYNAILAGLSQNDEGSQVLHLFCRMIVEGVELTDFTLTSVVAASSLLSEKRVSEQIHGFVIKFGVGLNAFIEAALLDMLTRCGRMSDAQKMFCRRQYKMSSANWASMICGFARNGQPEEALSLFCNAHREETMIVDEVILTAALGICGTLGFCEMGRQIHCRVVKSGFLYDIGVGNAIVSMYSKCCDIEDAKKAFGLMPSRNIVSWNGLIAGHLLHRQGDEALAVWSKLETESLNPDSITFVLIISSFRHTKLNLVNDCRKLFLSMKMTYNIEPTSDHYASFVSVLASWGFLEEAENSIANMPIEPVISVWQALLNGCRIHRNSTVGKRTVRHILSMEPQDPSSFILMSNIYSASCRWHCSETMRAEMRRKGFRKLPARSWLVHESRIHAFYARDKSHLEFKDIKSGLEILIIECQRAGYVPDTSFVLHEVEEGQKPDFLFHHSAKLAVTYGILMARAGRPVRVSKNIILCGDCHNFLKHVSVVTKKEICVRDTSGFHCSPTANAHVKITGNVFSIKFNGWLDIILAHAMFMYLMEFHYHRGSKY
ncbi:hypothetical protein Nepgr_030585 [Nepenthes gracilis]|uniref:DYW domain-containing protein n=1 Tax=Nepenthes gracilis TaxID=150966 RepID=A0AAD3TH95_NEPGR|nr:hypothetical protein Nepgr_030585 [Nepenthes gracilis]